MWKSKKFIVIAVVAVVVLAGSVGAVTFARTASAATSGNVTLLERVVAILNQQGVNITQTQLQNAFTQAQKEQRDQRLTDYLNNLVKQGKLNQADADKYKQWWDSRPNVPVPGTAQPFGMPGFRGGRGGMMGGHFFGGQPPKVLGTPTPTP